MKVDVEGIEAFVVIAQLQGFGRAAQALHISQSALSRRLQKMEAMTGVRLFERTTQRLELTPVARRWLPQARLLLTDYRSAIAALVDSDQRWAGRVTVACIPTAAAHFLPRAIGAYEHTHSGVQVRVLDLSAVEVLQAVRDGAAEFGISFAANPDHPGLAFHALFDDPLVVVCRRDHPLAAKKQVSFAELSDHRVARVGTRSGTSLLLDLALEQQGIKLQWSHEVEYHFSSALGLTEHGSVVTVLPRLAFHAKGHPELVAKQLCDPRIRRVLGIVKKPDVIPSPTAQGLIDAIRKAAASPGRGGPRSTVRARKAGE